MLSPRTRRELAGAREAYRFIDSVVFKSGPLAEKETTVRRKSGHELLQKIYGGNVSRATLFGEVPSPPHTHIYTRAYLSLSLSLSEVQ